VIPSFLPTSKSHDGHSNPSNFNTTNDAVDVSDVIEMSRKLNALKKNFCAQRNLVINAFARLSQILTPRQQAMILVRAQIKTKFDISSMELLKNVWQSVTSNEAPSVFSLLSMLPNQPGLKLPSLTDMSAPDGRTNQILQDLITQNQKLGATSYAPYNHSP